MKPLRFEALGGLVALVFLGAGFVSQGQPTSNNPEQDSQPIDLSNFYGKVAGTEGDDWFTHPDWKVVPKGLQTFDGILFDVSGTLLLRGQNMPQLKEAVRNIPFKRKCHYIHLLHGIGYADEDGTPVAIMEVHYGNGEKRQMPIIYGVHVRNWWKEKEEKVSAVSDPGSGVAWSGQGEYPPPDRASVRLFRSTFVNPLINEQIDHIDFVSQNSKAILCIVALSAGDKKPVVKSDLEAAPPPTK